jgi:hypothetical protein
MKFHFFIILLLLSHVSFAQNCCTGGVPLANNLNLPGIDSGLYVQIVYDRNIMNDFVARSKLLDDDSYIRYNTSFFVQASWSINKRISLGFMMNHSSHYLNRKSITTGREIKTNGIGDMVFTANYNLWNKGKHNFQLGAGIVLPTGKNDLKDKNFDILLPWDLQPGYGGWGGLIMAQYQTKKIFIDNLSYFGRVVYQHSFENKKPETTQVFKQGGEFQIYQGLGYNILLNKFIISPQAGFRLKFTNHDYIDNAKVESSGGIWFYNMLGLNMVLSQNTTLMAAYETPLYRYLNGSQLTTSGRIRFGIVMFFGAKEVKGERVINF